ncbi:MAG TPA: hypothetical protein VMU95_00395 [Trebonia sp.]|nr:hypothetical protein [Trebonia sp.]
MTSRNPDADRAGPDASGGRPQYQIRVRGRLGATIRSAFPGLRARVEGSDTVLTGVLEDQAALYGVLAEAEALGLELIEVRRLPPPEVRLPVLHRDRGLIEAALVAADLGVVVDGPLGQREHRG